MRARVLNTYKTFRKCLHVIIAYSHKPEYISVKWKSCSSCTCCFIRMRCLHFFEQRKHAHPQLWQSKNQNWYLTVYSVPALCVT